MCQRKVQFDAAVLGAGTCMCGAGLDFSAQVIFGRSGRLEKHA